MRFACRRDRSVADASCCADAKVAIASASASALTSTLRCVLPRAVCPDVQYVLFMLLTKTWMSEPM
jgi:hypothetical protein